MSVHSGSNWSLAVLVFEEKGKLEYPEKNLLEQGENRQQTQPTFMLLGPGIEPWPHNLVGGEFSQHCATTAHQKISSVHFNGH